MSVTAIGAASGAQSAADLAAAAKSKSDSVTQDFLAYMKETPAQRMEDSWLAAHGITKAAFDAMSPDQKAKILKQMQQDIELQIKKSTDAKTAKQNSDVML